MQDPDDSDAAPHDMVLNKAKRNKGIAAVSYTHLDVYKRQELY